MRSSSVVARLTLAAVSVGVLVTPLTVSAQRAHAAAPITAAEVDAHLRFLSSDLLEGRAPATRGGQLAAEYIASELREDGIAPGVNGSYFQEVPIDIVGARQQTIRVSTGGKAPAALRYPDDVVMWAGSATDSSAMRGEVVFVGYGINAPENRWNDFKGMDLKGKILLILVNDPPAPAGEPALFGGKAMTWYGRWVYKFEEAERQGAAGALIIHTTERAGYPWHTVVGSWAKEQRMLPRDASRPAPLGIQGWIRDTVAASLLSRAGLDLAALTAQAASRDFKPVPTGITIDASFRNDVAHMQSQNVVGVLAGRDAKLKNEYVAFSAHWDHLGIGPAVNGDSIYNGASDNASGVADLLAVARAAAEGPRAKRSMLFVFVTAEESGLLGSEWFGQHPAVPKSQIVAALNMDGGNVLGRTRDLTVLGDTKSSLGPMIAAMIRPMGMRISPDDHPERGAFYRSDHFSFAKVGIPSVSIGAGNDFVGRPKEWGAQQEEDYVAHRYHQPSDQYDPKFDLSGATQLSQIVLRLGLKLANDPSWPTWAKGAEFKR
ncbi:MAG TPA: M28 family peptidase [Gemmatimonadaceae bacterium]|nr:M28 family peptidase [Gemmatimonadaceae bacterium]